MNLLPTNLAALASLASDETSRYSMSGVHVQFDHDGSYRAAATDGRYLGIVSGPVPEDYAGPIPPDAVSAPNSATSAVIPVSDWTAAFKASKPKGKRKASALTPSYLACVPSWDTTLLASCDGAGSSHVSNPANVEGRFPRVDEIIPGGAPAASVTCNAQRLIDLLKAAIAIADSVPDSGGRVTLELRTTPSGAPVPIVVRAAGAECQQFTGLLMPLS